MTKEELAKIINKTQKDLTECETEETPENEDTENPAADSETVEDGETMEVRQISRFFDRLAHETMDAYSGFKNFFLISHHRQNY